MRTSSCPRCGADKSVTHFACPRCWWLLPSHIRGEIWRAYSHEGVLSDEYDAATDAALEYWSTEHPLETPAESQMELGDPL